MVPKRMGWESKIEYQSSIRFLNAIIADKRPFLIIRDGVSCAQERSKDTRELKNGVVEMATNIDAHEPEPNCLVRAFNCTEAADFLNCSPRMVAKLCQMGKLKAFRVGNRWRIPRKALIEYAGMA